ncbi:cadherin-related family member 5 [Rhinoderma darwinii]|uniref:cadherin-related family member 5 n=1 Tax=Rhinoderma darwinii TaxID=43563 RepID=UPI003F67A56F
MGPLLALCILFLIPMGCFSQGCRSVDKSPSIYENEPPGKVVTALIIEPEHTVEVDSTKFGINGTNLVLIKEVDYELGEDPFLFQHDCTPVHKAMSIKEENVIRVILICKRNGLTVLGETIFVQIINVNDNEPVFKEASYNFSIPENLQVSSSIGPAIEATDADQDTLYYELIGNDTNSASYFRLLSVTNPVIVVNKPLDYDRYPHIRLNLTARDTEVPGDNPSFTATTAIIIDISDSDDKPPFFQPCTPFETKICINNGYRSSVSRSELVTQPLQLMPGPLYAVDGDYGINDPISYSIIGGNNNNVFAINNANGNITMNKPIDTLGTILLQVMAFQTNDILKYSTTTVQIEVKEKNNFPPTFQKPNYFGTIPSNSDIRSFLLDSSDQTKPLQVFAADADFPDEFNAAVTYKIENSTDFSVLRDGYILTNSVITSPRTIVLLVNATDSTTSETTTTIVTVQVTQALTTVPTTTSTTTKSTPWTGTPTTPRTGPTSTTRINTGTGTTTTTTPSTQTTTSTTTGTGTTTTTTPSTRTTASTTTGTGTTTTTTPSTRTTASTTTGTGTTTTTTPSTRTTASTTTGTGTTTTTTPSTRTTASTTTGTGTTTTTTPSTRTTASTTTGTGTTTTTTPSTRTTASTTTGTGTTTTTTPSTRTTKSTTIGIGTTTTTTPSTWTKSTTTGTGTTAKSTTTGTGTTTSTTPGTGSTTKYPVPGTEGVLQNDKYYTATDMAILGATLGAVLVLTLIGLAFLIYKKYGNTIRSRLQRGSGNNSGGYGDNTEQLITDEDNVSRTVPSNLESGVGGDITEVSSGINPLSAAAVSTIPSRNAADGQPSNEADGASDLEDGKVKSILTKDLKEEGGYKSVWFREDAMVIDEVENGEADDDNTEEERNNQQVDNDNDDNDDEDELNPTFNFTNNNDLKNVSVL